MALAIHWPKQFTQSSLTSVGQESIHVEGAVTPQVTWQWVEMCSASCREDGPRLGVIIRHTTRLHSATVLAPKWLGTFSPLLNLRGLVVDFHELGL